MWCSLSRDPNQLGWREIRGAKSRRQGDGLEKIVDFMKLPRTFKIFNLGSRSDSRDYCNTVLLCSQ